MVKVDVPIVTVRAQSALNQRKLDKEYERKKWLAYKIAAYNYLHKFRTDTLASLNEYKKTVESLILFTIPPESLAVIQKRSYLKVLNNSLNAIQSIESLKITTNTYR